ncbi:MAG: pseudouridine synthase [Myxococcota bacterium]
MYEEDDAPYGGAPDVDPAPASTTRLARLLAQRGVASRREAERLIAQGEVTVNGEVVRGVVLVDPERDRIRIEGRPLPPPPEPAYFVMYKPRGCITTREDPQGRPTVFDKLGDLPRGVEAVGRLDFDTEGALLLTNDGDLANALTHPKNHVPKRYLVKVYRQPDDRDLEALRTGVFLEDGRTMPAKARVVSTTDKTNAWVEITVTEGRNRLVRRMLQALGHPVSKLRRESFATISIRGLELGSVRRLTGVEIKRLQDLAAGLSPSRAGRKKGKGFARAKPKPVRPGQRKRGTRRGTASKTAK